MNKIKTKRRKIILFTFLGLFTASFFTHFWGNLIYLVMEKEYFIPKTSSIFLFEGKSGFAGYGNTDTWIFGEDPWNYYFNLRNFEQKTAIIFSKKASKNCQGFDAEDISTWCDVKLDGSHNKPLK